MTPALSLSLSCLLMLLHVWTQFCLLGLFQFITCVSVTEWFTSTLSQRGKLHQNSRLSSHLSHSTISKHNSAAALASPPPLSSPSSLKNQWASLRHAVYTGMQTKNAGMVCMGSCYVSIYRVIWLIRLLITLLGLAGLLLWPVGGVLASLCCCLRTDENCCRAKCGSRFSTGTDTLMRWVAWLVEVGASGGWGTGWVTKVGGYRRRDRCCNCCGVGCWGRIFCDAKGEGDNVLMLDPSTCRLTTPSTLKGPPPHAISLASVNKRGDMNDKKSDGESVHSKSITSKRRSTRFSVQIEFANTEQSPPAHEAATLHSTTPPTQVNTPHVAAPRLSLSACEAAPSSPHHLTSTTTLHAAASSRPTAHRTSTDSVSPPIPSRDSKVSLHSVRSLRACSVSELVEASPPPPFGWSRYRYLQPLEAPACIGLGDTHSAISAYSHAAAADGLSASYSTHLSLTQPSSLAYRYPHLAADRFTTLIHRIDSITTPTSPTSPRKSKGRTAMSEDKVDLARQVIQLTSLRTESEAHHFQPPASFTPTISNTYNSVVFTSTAANAVRAEAKRQAPTQANGHAPNVPQPHQLPHSTYSTNSVAGSKGDRRQSARSLPALSSATSYAMRSPQSSAHPLQPPNPPSSPRSPQLSPLSPRESSTPIPPPSSPQCCNCNDNQITSSTGKAGPLILSLGNPFGDSYDNGEDTPLPKDKERTRNKKTNNWKTSYQLPAQWEDMYSAGGTDASGVSDNTSAGKIGGADGRSPTLRPPTTKRLKVNEDSSHLTPHGERKVRHQSGGHCSSDARGVSDTEEVSYSSDVSDLSEVADALSPCPTVGAALPSEDGSDAPSPVRSKLEKAVKVVKVMNLVKDGLGGELSDGLEAACEDEVELGNFDEDADELENDGNWSECDEEGDQELEEEDEAESYRRGKKISKKARKKVTKMVKKKIKSRDAAAKRQAKDEFKQQFGYGRASTVPAGLGSTGTSTKKKKKATGGHVSALWESALNEQKHEEMMRRSLFFTGDPSVSLLLLEGHLGVCSGVSTAATVGMAAFSATLANLLLKLFYPHLSATSSAPLISLLSALMGAVCAYGICSSLLVAMGRQVWLCTYIEAILMFERYESLFSLISRYYDHHPVTGNLTRNTKGVASVTSALNSCLDLHALRGVPPPEWSDWAVPLAVRRAIVDDVSFWASSHELRVCKSNIRLQQHLMKKWEAYVKEFVTDVWRGRSTVQVSEVSRLGGRRESEWEEGGVMRAIILGGAVGSEGGAHLTACFDVENPPSPQAAYSLESPGSHASPDELTSSSVFMSVVALGDRLERVIGDTQTDSVNQLPTFPHVTFTSRSDREDFVINCVGDAARQRVAVDLQRRLVRDLTLTSAKREFIKVDNAMQAALAAQETLKAQTTDSPKALRALHADQIAVIGAELRKCASTVVRRFSEVSQTVRAEHGSRWMVTEQLLRLAYKQSDSRPIDRMAREASDSSLTSFHSSSDGSHRHGSTYRERGKQLPREEREEVKSRLRPQASQCSHQSEFVLPTISLLRDTGTRILNPHLLESGKDHNPSLARSDSLDFVVAINGPQDENGDGQGGADTEEVGGGVFVRMDSMRR
eukprot:GHVN01059107.1.p1 GENE.GHVN01059107.1~~GHVN01059107.1.p1  ORF type:complete len:1592 (-),score=382.66 GHVN01059107.1:65-4840(-)